MRLIDQLVSVCEAYAKAEKLELSSVSTRVFNDGKKLAAILAGGDIQTVRFERAMVWFSANWPEGAEWPKAVTRPHAGEAAA
jgi:hypothetical protein